MAVADLELAVALSMQLCYYTHIIGFVVWTLYAMMHYKVGGAVNGRCAEGR
jgi:hypothetical protein